MSAISPSASLSAWEIFDQSWRSAFKSFWHLPALILATWLFDTLFAGATLYMLPFADTNDLWQRFINSAVNDGVRGIVFAPLVVAILRSVAGKPGELWSERLFPVMVFLTTRAFAGILLYVPVWLFPSAAIWMEAIRSHAWYASYTFLYLGVHQVPAYISYLAYYAVWARIALILPSLAFEKDRWTVSVTTGWRAMRGRYVFAFLATVLTILPYFVFDIFISTHFGSLFFPILQPVTVGAPLASPVIIALLVRSALQVWIFALTTALAAWLYREIMVRRTG